MNGSKFFSRKRQLVMYLEFAGDAAADAEAEGRLFCNKVIQNLAHPDKPAPTRTTTDQNVVDLQTRLGEALDQIAALDKSEANNVDSARSAWDGIFKSDGFFAEFDAERKAEEKRNALLAKAALVGSGARTSPTGILGAIGVANIAHRFYGEDAWISRDRRANAGEFPPSKSVDPMFTNEPCEDL